MGKDLRAGDVERDARLLQRQVDKLFGRDSTGDSKVEVILIDRTRYEPFRFEPIPYSHLDKQGREMERGADAEVMEERMHLLSMNADAANSALSQELRIESARRTRERFAMSKAGQKLIAAHRRMEHNVGRGVRGCPVCDGVVSADG